MTTPLPAARPSAFSTTGKPNSPARHGIERLVERLAGAETRRRHAVARHERLRERLARFQAGRSGGRAEQQPPVGRESIGDAQAQRQLRTDHGEVDLLTLGERERGVGIGWIDRDDAREPGDAGVPGRGHDFADVAIGGKPGDQRVLARAAAENKNSH